MMTFNEFLQYAKDHFCDNWHYDEECEVSIRRTLKNNGRMVSNLQVKKQGDAICPVLHMESYYHQYRCGLPMEDVMSAMLRDYDHGVRRAVDCCRLPLDAEGIRDHIIFRLVNYRKNRQLLETAPHIRFADLAITFLWLSSMPGEQIATVLINHHIMEHWGLSQEELIGRAMENTPRLFPARVCRMEDMLTELTGEECKDDIDLSEAGENIYIMTNQSGVNGASVILYDRFLEEFSDRMNSEYYIIPSSIHEVILIPRENYMEPEEIRRMIREVNDCVVGPDDYLSDSLYYYNREKGRIVMVD